MVSQRAKFMGPTWGPPGSCRPQMGPMLAPWTLLSGIFTLRQPPEFLQCFCVWYCCKQWDHIQYIPRNMHMVFALLCFVVVIHWLIFPYPSGLLHWHCGNLTIAPVPAKQPWWIWINTSCEFIMNDCITTTKQSTTKPCAYFLGYTVFLNVWYCSQLWDHIIVTISSSWKGELCWGISLLSGW